MTIKAQDIARYFLQVAKNEGTSISALRLHYMCYFAQGMYLAKYGERLFLNEIFAWRHGAVINSIYDLLAYNDPLRDPSEVGENSEIANLPNCKKLLLMEVYRKVMSIKGCIMKEIATQKPIANTMIKNGSGSVIEIDLIKEFFSSVY